MTNNVTIMEQSPRLPNAKIKGSRKIDVAGRHVLVKSFGAQSPGFVATWKTAGARYLVLTNGSQLAVLKRFIACLP